MYYSQIRIHIFRITHLDEIDIILKKSSLSVHVVMRMEATYSEKKLKFDMTSIANSGLSHWKYHEK